MRLRESYLRHKSGDSVHNAKLAARMDKKKARGHLEYARQVLMQATQLSDAAFTAESLLDSIQTMSILSIASKEMTRLAAINAAEDIMARAEDSIQQATEMTQIVSEPILDDYNISELLAEINESEPETEVEVSLPSPPTTLPTVTRMPTKQCTLSSISS